MLMSDRKWSVWGYKTDKPCNVCGDIIDNRLEPRFGYSSCREHAHIAPATALDRFDDLVEYFVHELKIPIQFTADAETGYIVVHAIHEKEIIQATGYTMLESLKNLKYKLYGEGGNDENING